MKPLQDEIANFKQGRVTETRRQKLGAVIDKLPENLRKGYSRISVDGLSDDEFDTLLGEVTTEVDGIAKETIARGAVMGRPSFGNGGKNAPTGAGAAKEATTEDVAEDDRRIMAGEEPMPSEESGNYVPDMPEKFGKWIDKNTERIERAKSLPYFMRDNEKYIKPLTITPQARAGADEAQKFNAEMMRAADVPKVPKPLTTPEKARYGAVTGTKLGRTATKAAFKVYEDMPAPTLTEEVTNNTLEIASAFGIKTPPKPMTFLEANEGRGNVSFGKGDEFADNCQASVAVHEARMRGLNVTALGYDPNVTSVSYKLGERFESIWQHSKTGKTPTPTMIHGKSFDDMLDKMEVATKATGRYHIGINMKKGGHVITAERLRDGRMIFYDAQSGEFLNFKEYLDRDIEYLEILKVDKLLLREDIFKAIARVL